MLHRINLNRPYSTQERDTIAKWCEANCQARFYAGHSAFAGFYGDALEFNSSSEVPWMFSEESDAMLFKLTWV